MKKTGEETTTTISGMNIIQRNDYQNFTLDSVLLADYIKVNRTTKNALEIGSGCGVISLLLAQRSKMNIKAIEIEEIMANISLRNVIKNGYEERIEILHDDIKNYKNHFKKDQFDVIYTNPPYFEYDGNEMQINKLEQLANARHEVNLKLDEIFKISSYLLRNSGYFFIVFRSDRVFEIIEKMKQYKLNVKRVQFCYTTINKSSKICLVEAMKDAKNSVSIEYPIFIYDEYGNKTEYINKLYE